MNKLIDHFGDLICGIIGKADMPLNAVHWKQRDKSIYLLHIGEQVLTSSYRKVRITHALYLRRAVNNETL